MTTEKLIVELDAKTGKLQKELNDTTKRLDGLEKSTKKSDKALLSMSSAGVMAGKAISATAAAATASAAALSAAAVSASNYARELRIASDISRESTGRMQELAFATNTVGVDMDKLADISKDSFEKIGDYLNTGGGGFQDFADAMKLTKEEATELANEFKYLSGTEILQEMVKRMEDAGVSASQMSHALEGMASDTTNLIPLFSDSSKELNTLTEEFNQLNIKLSDIELDKLDEVGKSIKTLSATVSGTTNKTVAALEEEITGVAELLTSQVGSIGTLVIQAVTGYQYMVAAATSSIMNLFREAEIASVEASIAIQETFGADFASALATADTAVNDFFRNISGGLIDVDDVEFLQNATGGVETLKAELQTLKDADVAAEAFDADYFAELMDKNIAKVNEFKESLKPEEKEEKEDDPLAQSFDIDQESMDEHLAMHEEYLAARRELYFADFEQRGEELFQAEIQAQQDMLAKKLINEEEYLKQVNKAAVKYGKLDEKQVKAVNKDKDKSNIEYTNDAINLSTQLFGSNKAASSVTAFINTAEGVTKALASQDYAGAAFTAVAGAAQILSINSATIGGGSSSVASAPSSPPSESSSQPSVTGEVEINESIGSGAETSTISNTVVASAATEDELLNVIIDMINSKTTSGEKQIITNG